MESTTIIGYNIKYYRELLKLTTSQVAGYLEKDSSYINNIESGEQQVSFVNLVKLADLFGIRVEDLIEKDANKHETKIAFAFKKEGLKEEDLRSIASFQRIVKNYIRMDELLSYEQTEH